MLCVTTRPDCAPRNPVGWRVMRYQPLGWSACRLMASETDVK